MPITDDIKEINFCHIKISMKSFMKKAQKLKIRRFFSYLKKEKIRNLKHFFKT